MTRSAWRSPRRVGSRWVVRRRRSPAGTTRSWRDAPGSVPHGPAAGGPGVAYAGPQSAAARVGDREVDVGGLAQAHGGVAGAGQPQGADGRRQGVVDRAGQAEGAVDREDAGPAGFEDADGEAAEGREQRGASGERHQRGTGTWDRIAVMTASAETPSISASGRSCTRWRRVGRARAFTSSGVT